MCTLLEKTLAIYLVRKGINMHEGRVLKGFKCATRPYPAEIQAREAGKENIKQKDVEDFQNVPLYIRVLRIRTREVFILNEDTLIFISYLAL